MVRPCFYTLDGKTLIRFSLIGILIGILIGPDPSGKLWLRCANALLKSECLFSMSDDVGDIR